METWDKKCIRYWILSIIEYQVYVFVCNSTELIPLLLTLEITLERVLRQTRTNGVF